MSAIHFIVFLPLLAAVVAGFANKSLGSTLPKLVTTGALIVACALSWPIFISFLTGHADVPTAVDAVKRGAFDFYEKPFSDNALVDRIEQALAQDARVLLVIAGKAREHNALMGDRPRGAIRAQLRHWLDASPLAHRIAAVRGAHPRHGGAGALYIVLRRSKNA